MTAEIIDQANELAQQRIDMAIAAHRLNRNAVSAERCEECDEPIPEPRRAAVPGCQTCASCQADLELLRKQRGVVMDRAEIDLILESKPRKFHRNNLVKGVGKNDSPFCTGAEFDGKVINHRAYDIWCGMLQRATCPSYQEKHPHYKGCSVCEEWLTFTTFFAWWKKNHVDGWELDKDFTVIGNKVYSPETCLFIPSQLNSFINAKGKHNGELPVGVMFVPSLSKFKSVIIFMRQYHYLGLFESADDAHLAWITKKLTFAHQFKEMCSLISPWLFEALITRVLALSNAPSKYEIAERIADEIETAEHLKKLRAQRAA